MFRVPNCLRVLSVLLLVTASLAAQKKALTHDDYDQWRSLRGTTISLDGAWVAYEYAPQFGDGVLEVREAAGDKVYSQPLGSAPHFTTDGRFVVFTIGKSKVEEREKKIAELRKKAKAGNKPATKEGGEEPAAEPANEPSNEPPAPRRGGGPGARRPAGETPAADRGELAMLELSTGKVEKLGKVKGSIVSDDVPFLVFHKDKPDAVKKPAAGEAGEEKAATTEPATTEPAAPEPAAAEPAAPEASSESPRRGRAAGRRGPPSDPLEAKRAEGTDLVVRNLTVGSERTIHDVVAYGLSSKGKWLWYHTSAKKPAKDAKYGLFVEPLAGGEAVSLLEGLAHFGNVTIDRSEQAIAFTSDKEDFAADKPVSDLYLWEGAAGPARRIAFVGAAGMPDGKCAGGNLSFSRDGAVLAFAVQDVPEKDPLPILPEDKVVLDIWNWRDGQLQTQQQKRGNRDRNAAWTAVWRRQPQQLVVLGDDALRSLRFVGTDGARLLGTDDRAYQQEETWDGHYADVWLVDGVSGKRTRVLEHFRGNVQSSPGGRYLVWFGTDYHWWSYDVANGERRDLTGALSVPFHLYDDDHPEPAGAFGLAGFTQNDESVLLDDEFDVWQVAPATGRTLCVTDGFGRAHHLRLRLQPLPRDDDSLWVDDELMLAATDTDTMAEGFFVDSLSGSQPPRQLVMANVNFGELRRPKHGDRLFFTRSTFREFPDLWTANADFGAARKLSDANPQQKDYRWGDSELVQWIDGNGQQRKGVLIKPDGFDPTKKYPMLVYFYERMTQGLHNYTAPAPGTSPNASYYVSNGYLWFEPDVVYQVGYPGESCVKCVVAGVQHLIAQGFVDEKAIGAAGHSWGGYQTAFLVTRTNIFAAVESGAPVSDMMSAYGGIRYSTGISRQFQYERTQSRIGGTPWQYPLRYQENSPIYFADRVQTPVLIMANDQDGAVPWTQGIEYFTALRRLGKECYLFNYNGEDHGLRQRQNMRDWTRRMSEYFDCHLRGKPAPKWMCDGVPYAEREAEKLPLAPSYIDAYVKPAPVEKAEASAVPAVGTPAEAPAAATAGSGDEVRADAAAAPRGRNRGGDRSQPPAMKLKVGDAAPDFAVVDDKGELRHLADFRGHQLLVWFYPKADTPGCTTEGCGLRDQFAEFARRGVTVLGVSVDPVADNAAFRDKHSLPFPLLCDVDRAMCIAYGAAADKAARAARRIAFLIDVDGSIVRAWDRVDVSTFAKTALGALPL